MNFLTKTVMIGLFLVSSAVSALPIYSGGYNYLGSVPRNLSLNGDPHNFSMVDAIFNQDVEAILDNGLTNDEEVLISGLSVSLGYENERSFNWSVTGTMPWSVAGFGVKAGPTHYYFSLDENTLIPVSGTLDLLDELVEEGFNARNVRGVSHVDIFGVRNDNVSVIAPETAILTALGFGGILAFRRKKQM